MTANVDYHSSGFFANSKCVDARNSIFTDNSRVTYTHPSSRTAEILATLQPADRKGYYIPRCMDGTRESIFREIDEWLDNYDLPNILWLCGSPGAGKSTVASSMVSKLMERSRLGSRFFFQRGHDTLGDPSALWRTVAYDLAQRDTTFAGIVVEALKGGKIDIQWPDIHLHFKYLILEPLMKTYASSTPPVIVIDALDECDYDSLQTVQRNALLDTFVRWSSLPGSFKLIVTGRDDRVTASFRDVCKHTVLPTGSHVDIETNNDIRLFFQNRFAETPGSTFPKWPGDQILDDLTTRAAGLFVWAETMMEVLKQGLPKDQLYLILDGYLGVGDNLSSLYSQILNTSFRGTTGRTLEVVKLMISAIILAQVPFLRDDFHLFVSEDESSVKFVLDKLSSVIFTGKQDNYLRIGHLSFSEFMCDPDRCPKAFVIDLDRARLHMAMTCFQRMKEGLKFNICDLKTSYLRNDVVENLSELIKQNIPNPLSYSCHFWGAHLRDTASAQEGHNSLLEEVREFFHHRLLFWLEVMSLVKKVLEANVVVLTAVPWIEKLDIHLSAFATDASRFILNFVTPIQESVPHIYLSALPFSPSGSLIAQHYEKLFPNTLSVVFGRDRNWSPIINVFKGHTHWIKSVEFSRDGKWIVSGSEDWTVRVWDVKTGQPAAGPFEGHTSCVTSVAFSPNSKQVVSGSIDGTVRIWDAKTGQVAAGPFEDHTGHVYSVAFSPNGSLVVSGSEDCIIRIWDVRKGLSVNGSLIGHTGRVKSVTFSADGTRIASGSGDTTICIWDVKTGQVVAGPSEGHTDEINSVAFSPDGRYVVSGSSDHTVRIWDAEACRVAGGPFNHHKDQVTSVAFSSDSRRIVSGSRDTTFLIWDVETGEVMAGPFESHTDRVNSVSFSPNGHLVVSGSDEDTICIWNVESSQGTSCSSKAYIGLVTSIACSPDGKQVVSGIDNTVYTWDIESSKIVIGPLKGHTARVRSVTFSEDGKQVVSESDDETILVWDSQTGQQFSGPFNAKCIAPRCPTFNRYTRIFPQDSEWMEDLRIAADQLRCHIYGMTCFALSSDNNKMVSASLDKTVRIWNVGEGVTSAAASFEGHTSCVNSVAFSPNGSLVASGSDDMKIRIWNVDTGREAVHPFRGHTDRVSSVAFLPDGKRVVSGSYDGTIRIWNIEICQTAHVRTTPTDNTCTSLFQVGDPDQNYIRTGWLLGSREDQGQGIANSRFEYRNRPIIFWAPETNRQVWGCLETLAVLGVPRVIKLDLSRFVYGESWTRCYSLSKLSSSASSSYGDSS